MCCLKVDIMLCTVYRLTLRLPYAVTELLYAVYTFTLRCLQNADWLYAAYTFTLCCLQIDFTLCSGLIFVLSMVLILFGLACIIVYAVSGPNYVCNTPWFTEYLFFWYFKIGLFYCVIIECINFILLMQLWSIYMLFLFVMRCSVI